MIQDTTLEERFKERLQVIHNTPIGDSVLDFISSELKLQSNKDMDIVTNILIKHQNIASNILDESPSNFSAMGAIMLITDIKKDIKELLK